MSKKTLLAIGVSIVLTVIVSLLLWQRFTSVDSTDKIHADLYERAKGIWNPQVKVLPFRPQEIDGQTIGSSTGLRLEWQPPTKPYNHFVITITDPISGYTRTESGEHDRFSLDPTDLLPATEYVFAFQACLDPRCKTWYIAQDEYRGMTTAQVWSADDPPTLLNP